MPRELRFCRNCGYRLGEGSAEYTETVRFQNAPPGTLPRNSSGSFDPSLSPGGPLAAYPAGQVKKRRRGLSGMTWIFLGLLIFFVAAAAFTAIIRPDRPSVNIEFGEPDTPRVMVGVDGWETTDGGVTFENVTIPDSPADKAGLVGGDIITTFDGQPVTTDDEMRDVIARTPVGKTVEIVFVRDGETQTSTLTPISNQEYDRLSDVFRNRPEGVGRFGFDDDDTERVAVPGTTMFGVRVDDITPNLPADLAGIKEGDVIIEFDGAAIRTPEELATRVRRAIPYSTVKVVLMRGAERLEIPVKMGKV